MKDEFRLEEREDARAAGGGLGAGAHGLGSPPSESCSPVMSWTQTQRGGTKDITGHGFHP